MVEFFECERHAGVMIETGSAEGCAGCLAMLDRDRDDMTGDERAEELKGWLSKLMSIPFSLMHKRIEELVGRPVWTHELGLATERLIEEARGARTLTSIDEVINDLRNTGKPVIEIS